MGGQLVSYRQPTEGRFDLWVLAKPILGIRVKFPGATTAVPRRYVASRNGKVDPRDEEKVPGSLGNSFQEQNVGPWG